jgi:hypothetical protein
MPSILNRNLAFRSPYTNEPHLGIDVEALHERHTAAKRSLDAELGALARRGGKRQAQELRPAGKPHGYTYAGYGLGVASWDDASYVYAGELNYTHSVASGESGALDEWLSSPRVSRIPVLVLVRYTTLATVFLPTLVSVRTALRVGTTRTQHAFRFRNPR